MIVASMIEIAINHGLKRGFHALDYFHIIARRVFRRQQSESRATASLNAVQSSAQVEVWVSIHRNVYRLSRLHVAELRLFEISDHPHARWHERHERLSYLHVIA